MIQHALSGYRGIAKHFVIVKLSEIKLQHETSYSQQWPPATSNSLIILNSSQEYLLFIDLYSP